MCVYMHCCIYICAADTSYMYIQYSWLSIFTYCTQGATGYMHCKAGFSYKRTSVSTDAYILYVSLCRYTVYIHCTVGSAVQIYVLYGKLFPFLYTVYCATGSVFIIYTAGYLYQSCTACSTYILYIRLYKYMHCTAGSPNISCNSKFTSCSECTSYIGTAYQDLYLNTTVKQALQ
jgi:hypothetical protein